jgi:hypothetical protein
MKRRDALAAGAALAASLATGGPRAAAAGVIHARRTRRYTWAPNLWTMNHVLAPNEDPVTLAYACGVPDDFSAIRVGFLSASAEPWQITKVVAMTSNSWNDYITPTGGAAPVILTFGGQAAGTVLPSPGDPAPRGRVIPSVTWSDWVPLRSQPADPATGMRVLMLRALVPGGQTITCCNGTWGGYSGAHGGSTAINRGYDIFTGGLKGIDRVSNPIGQQHESTSSYIGNNPCNGTIFGIIQAKTTHEGYALCQVGESKFFGTSTTAQMWNWQLRAVGALGAEYAGRVPIGYCCTAVGGYDSAHAFGLARQILPEVDPAIVDIPSYNGNERLFGLPYTDLHSEQVQMAMTRDFMQYVRGLGGIPILASPMPNCRADAPPSPRIANNAPGFRAAFTAWKRFAEKHDDPVFDLYASLGADEAGEDCRYREASITKDGNHPDNAGHALLVEPYLALIKPLLGLQ